MPSKPKTFRPRGSRDRVEQKREADSWRGSARARGYTTAWDKAAKDHLAQHPLCRYCELGLFGDPSIVAATLVDHLIPHRGDHEIFWNRRDWVSSCAPCHSGPKQAAERDPHALRRLANAVRAAGGGGVESWGPLPSGPAG